jgi:DNA-binding transcriptional regulator PaaX
MREVTVATTAGSELETMREALAGCWSELSPGQQGFWETVYTNRVLGTRRITGRFRSYGQWSRFGALAFGAVVPALAGFSDLPVRIAAAVVAAIAVILNGAAAIFRTDQRVIVNRTATRKLLNEGWKLVGGREPYGTAPTKETFGLFMDNVIRQLDEYLAGYVSEVDRVGTGRE